MPEVVSKVEDFEQTKKVKRVGGPRNWAVAPELFPCELSADTQRLADKAVKVSAILPLLFNVVYIVEGEQLPSCFLASCQLICRG